MNPKHLFLGTQAENLADAKTKGRIEVGEDRIQSKLTEADILQIRQEQSPQNVLAQRFGVDQSLISRIRSGKKWSHVQ